MKLEGQLYTLPNNVEIRLPQIKLVEKNEETGEYEETDDHLYISETLFVNLYFIRQDAKKYSGDILYVIDGTEGSGKSTLGRQVAIILDNNFDHKRICYSTKQAVMMHKKLGKWSSIQLDESKEDLDRKSTMSKKNKWFMNFLSQSRQAHKFLQVVLPSIYDLDKYVAEHRARFLIHCYKQKGRHPGHFEFYGPRAIKYLFSHGARFRSYPAKPAFRGRFTKGNVVDLDEYDKRKAAAIQKYYEQADIKPKTEAEIIREFIGSRMGELDDIKKELNLNNDHIGAIFGVSGRTLYNYAAEYSDS